MRRCYLISFEIQSDKARTAFTDAIKRYNFYCPINATCWAIVTEQTAAQIRDALSTVLTPVDRLFVIRSGTEAAWRNNYGPQHDDWLKKNL